jgi:hypothetical protein
MAFLARTLEPWTPQPVIAPIAIGNCAQIQLHVIAQNNGSTSCTLMAATASIRSDKIRATSLREPEEFSSVRERRFRFGDHASI